MAAGYEVFGFSTKAGTAFGSAEFLPGDVLLFGPESCGLPARVLAATVPLRIPMQRARSLNLAISVARRTGYEVWRQLPTTAERLSAGRG